MKLLPLFLILFLFATLTKSFAQLDNSNGLTKSNDASIGIIETPAKTITKPNSLNLDPENGFKTAHQEQQKEQQKAQAQRDFENKGIVSSAKIAKERFSQNYKKINGQYAVIDQNLGSFRSDSKYVKVYCRDFQQPDNDRVTIYHNGIPVVYNITLVSGYQSFKIPLQIGQNIIAFKALNQGTSGPNTAAFKVYDDSGNLISSNQWELATGAKASIAITKAK
ncbi:hypothetical protein [Tenacibaculum sp. UWU-22]|uniref:hypothetical protein n=1 Tax=Tenacibaculum sp. UWU-22 TaxID=3234187 RepID=UPI0034DB3912